MLQFLLVLNLKKYIFLSFYIYKKKNNQCLINYTDKTDISLFFNPNDLLLKKKANDIRSNPEKMNNRSIIIFTDEKSSVKDSSVVH